MSEGGRRYQPGGNTALGSFDRAGKYGVDANTQRVRVVWHYRASNEQRVFTIRYRFRGLAVAYDDVVDVNLQVWGDEWPVAVNNLSAEMDAAASRSRSRAPSTACGGLPSGCRASSTARGPAPRCGP